MTSRQRTRKLVSHLSSRIIDRPIRRFILVIFSSFFLSEEIYTPWSSLLYIVLAAATNADLVFYCWTTYIHYHRWIAEIN